MNEQASKEHGWLKQLVGEWNVEIDAAGPGGKKQTGTERVRSLGGLWILAEGRSTTHDGADAATVMTLGYNPEKSAYVGTFIASMMTHMWLYQGWIDRDQNALVLDTEGPSFEDMSKRCRYKDTIRIIDRDYRTLTSSYQGEAAAWYEFMVAHYRR
jgi:hypothetical protein